jgi:hypothetical protein
MYFIASSFSGWSPGRRTGSDEIDSSPPEERDGMLESDMERGMNETYARLDELLARG